MKAVTAVVDKPIAKGKADTIAQRKAKSQGRKQNRVHPSAAKKLVRLSPTHRINAFEPPTSPESKHGSGSTARAANASQQRRWSHGGIAGSSR